MQVKCDYCGSFMEDTDYSCPNCGATNAHLKRTAPETPTTIEELKAWYEDRHLPPYETTRFFIGIDTKEPKAFGIYKDGMSYIVYKNKADGSRAVRYSGNDEAYAVNELFLRLKEEILNQKNHQPANNKDYSSTAQQAARKGLGCLGALGKGIFWVIGCVVFFLAVGFVGASIEELRPIQGDYYAVDNQAYYFDGYELDSYGYDWWQYNDSRDDWELYSTMDNDKDFPEGITRKNHVTSLDSLADKIGFGYDSRKWLVDESTLNVLNSRIYKDTHHSAPNQSSYYIDNGRSYYYLNDLHGSAYGSRDNTGWYIYEDTGWEYYCSSDDRDMLGDDLWYDADKYSLGSSYNDYVSGGVFNYSGSDTWNSNLMAADFGNTTWYSEYEAATAAYEEYNANNSSTSSNNDSSWDWDSSSDSWDSGSTDWGSDW